MEDSTETATHEGVTRSLTVSERMEGKLDEAIAEVKKLAEEHETLIWKGRNGKGGIIPALERIEDRLGDYTKMLWIVVTAAVTGSGALLFQVVSSYLDTSP